MQSFFHLDSPRLPSLPWSAWVEDHLRNPAICPSYIRMRCLWPPLLKTKQISTLIERSRYPLLHPWIAVSPRQFLQDCRPKCEQYLIHTMLLLLTAMGTGWHRILFRKVIKFPHQWTSWRRVPRLQTNSPETKRLILKATTLPVDQRHRYHLSLLCHRGSLLRQVHN